MISPLSPASPPSGSPLTSGTSPAAAWSAAATRSDTEGPPDDAAGVRNRVRQALLGSGERCDLRPAQDALLVASELATNALMHGGGITGFRAQVVADALVLAISDRADAGPVRRLPGDHRPGGFGWPIIEHLAREVVVEPGPAVDGATRAAGAGGQAPASGRPVGKTITVTLPLR
ncbi:ATP-binding protein [Streptomyces sp. NBC_01190]|uniref:ATP-binding protein n=1 Tax=Streptomyces sp. NBC_01190 TaxID=2903767 RepID=UPI00386A54C5|nr:ATP-binding protein [Streptomyces sp. NBC_01190]